MSAKLPRRVLESGLEPGLKPTAVVLGLLAGDDGRLFPGWRYVAWLLGVSPRTALRHFQRLEQVGVLIRVTKSRGRRRTEYQFNAKALPTRPPWSQRCHPRHRSGRPNGDTRVTVRAVPTVTPATVNGDTGDHIELVRRQAIPDQCVCFRRETSRR